MCNSLLEPIVGLVYLAVDIFSRQEVAVKLEHASAHTSQLQNEYEVYKSLAGGAGIPAVRWFGREGDYNALVLECLGPSLEVIFSRCNYKFSLKTVLLLADQLVQTFTMFRRLTARILT
jgi:serine/threonine protein kinase